MNDSETEVRVPRQVTRTFVQPTDASSFYSDLVQIVAVDDAIVLQFYETIPGVPAGDGIVTDATTKLRSTVTVSKKHAEKIMNAIKESLGK